MADSSLAPLEQVSPLRGWAHRFAELAPAVSLVESPISQTVVRIAHPSAFEQLDLPGACGIRRSAGNAETAIWLGPDESLLCSAELTPTELLASVEWRAGTTAYAADATGHRTRLIFRGPHATTILRHGCAIDISPRAFGHDDAVQTMLGGVGVILHTTDDLDGFEIYVRRSFADHLAAWLVDAATEYVATEYVATEHTYPET